MNVGERTVGVIEGDEETLGAFLAGHHGLEGVDVGATLLVLLFHMQFVSDSGLILC